MENMKYGKLAMMFQNGILNITKVWVQARAKNLKNISLKRRL